MRRLAALFLAITVVASLVLTSCGGQPSGSQASPAAKKTKLGIAAGRPADAYFVLSYGMASLINKYSTKYSAEPIATSGIANDSLFLINSTEERKRSFLLMASSARLDPQYIGTKGFDPRFVGMQMLRPEMWITFDKNIKTLADFKGKTIAIGRKNTHLYTIAEELLRVAGVLNDVKLMPGNVGERLTALGDGVVQVNWSEVDWDYPTNTFTISSQIQEIQRGKTIYFLGLGTEQQLNAAIDAGAKIDPAVAAHRPFLLKGGTLPNQPEAIQIDTWAYQWGADIAMPETIVYDVTKILYEHSAELGKFHILGNGITKDFLPCSDDFGYSEEMRQKTYHPGALKFYKEAGVKKFTFGARQTS